MRKILTPILVCLLAATGMTQPAATFKSDSTQIRATVLSFYNWYMKNHARLNSFELYTGIKTKDAPPYKINWKEAEKYFAYIRSSVPQLGEVFIANQRAFLKECDSAFKEDPEGDVPYGFDYDWYTNSQEDASYLVDELKKSKQWVTTVNGSTADVDVLGYYMDGTRKIETVVMCFTMNKQKGKWRIAKIGCPYTDPPPMEEIKRE
jgi:hypothetical protein